MQLVPGEGNSAASPGKEGDAFNKVRDDCLTFYRIRQMPAAAVLPVWVADMAVAL